MKRIAIFLLCAVLLSVSNAANAQDNRSGKTVFGLRAAFDVNLPGDYHYSTATLKVFEKGYGFTVGGVCYVDLSRNFYFEPGLSFYYDSYPSDVNVSSSSGHFDKQHVNGYKLGVRVPLVFGYNIGLTDRVGLAFYTGPEVSFALSSRAKVKDNKGNKTSIDLLDATDQRFVDVAWKIGVGFPFDNFMLSVDAAIGVSNISKARESTYRENRVTAGLTYYF